MPVNRDSGHTSEQPKARRTQAERSATTRAALIKAARELFATKGYAGTGREEIVAAAGVTRGAMYHHFSGKDDLFLSVFEEVEDEVLARVGEAAYASGDAPMDHLRAGAAAYLDAALDPAMQRICLLDAPAVLDDVVRRNISDKAALGMVRMVLDAGVESGAIERQPVEPLARLLLASLMEAALYVAHAGDQAAARAEVGVTVQRMLDRL